MEADNLLNIISLRDDESYEFSGSFRLDDNLVKHIEYVDEELCCGIYTNSAVLSFSGKEGWLAFDYGH